MQAQYESYYGISEDAWKQNVSDDETTYEASLKKDIMKNLQNAVLERQNAKDYKISLSDEDKAKIKETAKAFMKDNDAKISFGDAVYYQESDDSQQLQPIRRRLRIIWNWSHTRKEWKTRSAQLSQRKTLRTRKRRKRRCSMSTSLFPPQMRRATSL